MPTVLGVDFGTTNTSASLVQQNGQEIALRIGPANRPDTMRTAALFMGDGGIIAGDRALEAIRKSPAAGRLLTAFKQLLGEQERGLTRWRMIEVPPSLGENLKDDPNGEGTISVRGQTRYVLDTESRTSANCPEGFSLKDVRRATTAVLKQVHSDLTKSYGRLALDNLVMGVPVGFPDTGKAKLARAAEEAGLTGRNGIAFLQEPIAIALAYGIEHKVPKRVLVFDHGGGTLDISVVDIISRPGSDFRYKVLGQSSHDRAGRYYDRLLLKAVLEDAGESGSQVLKFLGVKDPLQIAQPSLLDQAENVKERICDRLRSSARVSGVGRNGPVRFAFPFGDFSFSTDVRSETLERALSGELDTIKRKILEAVAQAEKNGALGKTGAGMAGIEGVLMAGGSSRVPLVTDLVRSMFPNVPIDDRYAGSRTSTAGFARAVQYRTLIDELTDTEYGLYDPDRAVIVPVVPLGQPIANTSMAVKAGAPDGFYASPLSDQATVIVFAHQDEHWSPVLQAKVESEGSTDPMQVVIEVDQSLRPCPKALNIRTGKELAVKIVLPGEEDWAPVIERGQIVRYRNNGNKSAAESGTGYVDHVIGLRSGVPTEFALGELKGYKLIVRDPSNSGVTVWAKDNKDFETYHIEFPRPGEEISLETLDGDRFQTLPSGEFHTFHVVDRPADADRWVRVQQPDAAAPASEREVNRPVEQEKAPEPPRTIGSNFAKYLEALKRKKRA